MKLSIVFKHAHLIKIPHNDILSVRKRFSSTLLFSPFLIFVLIFWYFPSKLYIFSSQKMLGFCSDFHFFCFNFCFQISIFSLTFSIIRFSSIGFFTRFQLFFKFSGVWEKCATCEHTLNIIHNKKQSNDPHS